MTIARKHGMKHHRAFLFPAKRKLIFKRLKNDEETEVRIRNLQ